MAVLAVVANAAAAPAQGQEILDNLGVLAEENAQFYMAPLVNGLGFTLNSGFHQTADTHQFLGFDLGVRFMAALPPSSAEYFQPVIPGSVTYQGVAYDQPYEAVGDPLTPTAVGDGDGLVLQPRPGGAFYQALVGLGLDPNEYQVQFPAGAGIPAVPFVVLQGSVGVGFGTDVTLRYLPSYDVHEDVGTVSAFGYGIKHSLTSWLPAAPMVDVAVTAGWQDLTIGEYLDASAMNYGIIASVQTGPVTLYGIGRREQATVDVSYTIENASDNPALPVDGLEIAFRNELPSQTRLAAGATLRLIGIELSAEYSFADYNTLAAKAGFSIN